jgi:hypothetical protein
VREENLFPLDGDGKKKDIKEQEDREENKKKGEDLQST